MIRALTSIKLDTLIQFPDLGLLGSVDYIHRCNDNHSYKMHFETIRSTLGDSCDLNPIEFNAGEDSTKRDMIGIDRHGSCMDEKTMGDCFHFMAGTIFLLNVQVISSIAPDKLLLLYDKLNTIETVDKNWQEKMKFFKKNTKGANNDYHYRHLHGKSLHSDFMIEHSFERYLGILVKTANLKVYGVNVFKNSMYQSLIS